MNIWFWRPCEFVSPTDPMKIGVTAGEVGKLLLDGEQRIMMHAGFGESAESSEI